MLVVMGDFDRSCQLCYRPIPPGEWGYADGPLCHPDSDSLPDCYHLWTVYGVRPWNRRGVDAERALAQLVQYLTQRKKAAP